MANNTYRFIFDTKVPTLLVDGFSVLAINDDPPTRTLGSFILARSDKRKVNSAFYTERHILITCNLTQNSRALFDAQFDVLMGLLEGLEKVLIIPQGNGLRQYTATLAGIRITEAAGGYSEFILDFLCSDNYGYDLNFTQLLAASGRTLYNYTDNFNLQGSAPYQVPIIKVTISAVTNGSASIMLTNPGTNQTIVINRTWAAGDLLIVDSQNKSVQVNGVDVDYTGAIPEWSSNNLTGNGNTIGYLNYQDGFLTRTMSIFVYYYKRWK